MYAFDADVLIYAATKNHPVGRRIRRLFGGEGIARVGSVLLLPELLSKPTRMGLPDERKELGLLLGRLELRPVNRATAEIATALAATYGLRAADAVHLATAVETGAEYFLTNNRGDFKPEITETAITYPEDLPGT